MLLSPFRGKCNCKSIEKKRNVGTKVEIIRYFCIVKRLDSIFRKTCLLLFVFLTTHAWAGENNDAQARFDTMEVSLLTCSPGDEVWSLYGHTAIRLNDRANNQDIVANYGMFSFSQPYFVLRFVFGRTDYQMGIQSYDSFLQIYAYAGRGVVEQTLNLSRDEKVAIYNAILKNYLPENREYRYNFFYDNCTTRARDILLSHIRGQIDLGGAEPAPTTYRKEIHRYAAAHPWARFGNDLLLGVKADSEISVEERQFLPENLQHDFDRATIATDSSKNIPLVKSTVQTLLPQSDRVPRDLWDTVTPIRLFALLLLVVAVSTILEYRRRRMLWGIDMALFGLCGLAGLILTAMIFSDHPTVSLNLQIFILNPLFLYAFRPKVFLKTDKCARRFRLIVEICVVMAIISHIFQTFAEGIGILALILLIRIEANQRLTGKREAK